MSDSVPPRTSHWKASDLRAAGRLATQATLGITELVENLHHNILRLPGPLGRVTQAPSPGITGLVYRSIRGVTRLVGGGIDRLLAPLPALLGPDAALPSPEREVILAALNGVLGDHLHAAGNPLAIRMGLFRQGLPLDLQQALPDARAQILLQIHGLCMSPRQWDRGHGDAGIALAAAAGCTPLHLYYNTGLPIAENGRLLSLQLQMLLHDWPVPLEGLVIVGHSMGGLVARSACQQAARQGNSWLRQLRKMVFLGTPHLGAPLERGGHAIDLLLGASPYTAAFARLGRVRSAGITDLRHGEPQAAGGGPLPLPAGVGCYAVAGTLGSKPGALTEVLLGDGLVPLASAFGHHRLVSRRLGFAPEHRFVARGIGHLDLMADPAVFEQLRRWIT
jgi:pimeloyl-ACP methyl ester carboxylesterase